MNVRARIEEHILQGVGAALFTPESEEAVLAAILRSPADCEDALQGLSAEHFADGVVASLFDAATKLMRAGSVPSAAMLRDAMGASEPFAEWGGIERLNSLTDLGSVVGLGDHVAAVVDRARRRALSRVLDDARTRLLNTASGPADSLLSALIADAGQLIEASGSEELVSAEDASNEMFAQLDDQSTDVGVKTGIEALDERMGPMQPGELILLAGRSGMMKSGVNSRIALNVARSGVGFIAINMEMSVAQMTRRYYSDWAHERWADRGPEYGAIKRKTLDRDQRAMLDVLRSEFKALPLKQRYVAGLTLEKLRTLVKRQAARWRREGIRLGAVSVDHVGLMRFDKAKSRYEAQTELAIGLKTLAGELGCPIIALVQINREVEKRENRRPQLHDLRDSGAWEENADVAIGLYREAYYALKEPEPQDNGGPGAMLKWSDWDRRRKSKALEAILMKIREGEEGPVNLWADPARNAVRSHAPGFWEG